MKLSPGVVFFFSSRRRHTRWPRDWSSDVCSSDLMFCVHLIIIELVYSGLDVKLFEGRFGVVWLLTMAATTAVAALVYRYVESPLRRFRSVGRRSVAPEVSTAAMETIAA